ncbi:hypothetical protein ACQQCD_08460 [Pseudarthrobacter sp. J1763]|uniref:hypothetical protein n=1 Tax=Pseudarthrobacter sp. J1763 TaxID=3420445 RepID=UPI003D26AD75
MRNWAGQRADYEASDVRRTPLVIVQVAHLATRTAGTSEHQRLRVDRAHAR